MANSTFYDAYIQALRRWLWIEDEEGIRITIATAIAAMMPGDPIWLFVIDPPGALKTEICRSLTGSRVYSVDALTPQSLISGFRAKKGERIDILPDLDGKVLIIKDFTTILNQPERIRDELLSKLRAAFDGSLEQAFGSGVKKKGYQATFGIIAAVTPVIEIYYKIHSLLGERFISVKTGYNRQEAVKSALKQSGKEAQMRDEIRQTARAMLDFYEVECRHTNLYLTNWDIDKIAALGESVAILRSSVARDYQRAVLYNPEAEVGTRLSKQFFRLGQALEVLGHYDYSAIKRCGWDCVSSSRKRILECLSMLGETSTSELSEITRLSRNMVLTEGENLWLLEVLERKLEGNAYYFKISPKIEVTMRKAELIGG